MQLNQFTIQSVDRPVRKCLFEYFFYNKKNLWAAQSPEGPAPITAILEEADKRFIFRPRALESICDFEINTSTIG